VTAHRRARTTVLGSLTSQIGDRQVICAGATMLALNLDAIGASETALHVVNYDFDQEKDACTPRQHIDIAVRTVHPVSSATVYAPGCPPEDITVSRAGSRARLVIPRLDTYAVVRLA
jgi:hypothetical protein